MPTAPVNTNVLLGKGQIFFKRSDVDTGYYHLGNCSELSLEFEDDKIELKSSMDQSAGTYRKVTRERKCRLRIVGNEFNEENAALVTMASQGTLAQTTNSVVGEELASIAQAREGAYYQTAFRGISAYTVKMSATTLTEGTDYEVVNADAGVIRIFDPAPNWQASTAITIDYTYATVSLNTVHGGDTGNIEGELLFLGDPTTGPVMELKAWKCSVEPEGGLSLIGDDFLEWTLACEVLNDNINHPTDPYFQLIYTGTSR